MNNNGFFMLNKNILNSLIGKDLNKIGLVIYFICSATYSEKEYFINGEKIILKKGSLIYSQLNLANYFRKSIGWINKNIKELEKLGICENKNTNKYSLIQLNNDFFNFNSGKQNENRMKQNNILINNNNILNIIIIEIEKYYFEKTGKIEKINITKKIENINFNLFVKSFDNYLKIKESDKTFYSYEFGLNSFLNSVNGFSKFLKVDFNDFLNKKNMNLLEIEETNRKRNEVIKKENQNLIEDQKKYSDKIKKLEEIRKSKFYIDNKEQIRSEVINKNKNCLLSESVFLAYESNYLLKEIIL